MKFELHDYWKHKNCLDVFIHVNCIIQDDNGKAILLCNWLTQGVDNYWICSDQVRLFIKRDQYTQWRSYNPVGNYL